RMLLAACLLPAPGIPPAAEEEQARGVVEKAVIALGGREALARHKAVRITMKGYGQVQPTLRVSVTHEIVLQPPRRLKTGYRFDIKGRPFTVIQVVNGTRAYRSDNGRTREANGPMLTHMQEGLYAFEVETLLPLLEDRAYALSPLAEIKVHGRP